MSRGSGSRTTLHVFNVLYSIFGLLLAGGALWFFVQIYEVTSLRNRNHYLLDYSVSWPQFVPWLFFVLGMVVFFVSLCGFSGAKKSSKGLLTTYVIFTSIVVLCLIAGAIVSLVCADTDRTDTFISDAIWDAHGVAKANRDVEEAFGDIEKRWHCCGASGPRDYKLYRDELPASCCDVRRGWFESHISYVQDCDFTNKLANERHGCSTVIAFNSRLAIKILSAGSFLIALIGLINIALALSLSKALRSNTRTTEMRHEAESKKILM